ncbi:MULTISPECIES: hypothetical protein [Bacillus]|uniref:hypothetical protein n=1 Tax=Bacillus TaxID=1386 RepID=UPI0002F91767|nr:hypothetical protein [Bacillus licheniformis]AYC54103.1 hypothetical protein C7M53_22925 [Bacillus licheniformis]
MRFLFKNYGLVLNPEKCEGSKVGKSIFLSEKDKLQLQMWGIVQREIGDIDDAGCDWYTNGDHTYIGSPDWHVSANPEIANLINSIYALDGRDAKWVEEGDSK